jgi:putative acetyltransferase
MLETGREQFEAVRLYERCGYIERGAYGGYPDNGLSVFYGKAL